MATKQAATKALRANGGRIFVVATNADYAKLCIQSLKRLPSRSHVELLSFASMEDVKLPAIRSQFTLFVSRLSDLQQKSLERASTSSTSKQLLFLAGLPVEAVASRLLRLNIRNPERLHIAAERDETSIAELIYRLVRGMAQSDGAQPIVDAWIEDGRLVLLAPSFVRLGVPLEKLARLIGTNQAKIGSFKIDEDGRYLCWPHADVHLGWDQFRQLVDPTAVLADMQKTKKFNQRYGAAIRALREELGLKQTDISGVTERQLRRVEHGEQAASKATLAALAKTHVQSLDEYLDVLAKRMATGD
jgi:DNA-binding transcriptional regulator YiaG